MPYNVDKGKNTLKESEILEPVHACLRELIERERLGKPFGTFSDDDVVAVTLLYSMVMGNRLLERLKAETVGINFSQEISNYFSIMLQDMTLGMSKVNVTQYYKGKEQKK
jgi:hypothetical protein